MYRIIPHDSTYITEAHIFYHLRIDIRSLKDLLQERVHDIIQGRILHTTFEPLGQRRSYGQCYDHIVSVLLGSIGGQCLSVLHTIEEEAYIAESPLLLGVRWLNMEFSRSVAILGFFNAFVYRFGLEVEVIEKVRREYWEKE